MFGVLPDGTSQQLPRLGSVRVGEHQAGLQPLRHHAGDRHRGHRHGQLHLYQGTKQADGDAFERAGLTNGINYGARSRRRERVLGRGVPRQVRKGTPAEFDLAEVDWDQSGARQNDEARANGLTLNRIEDGTWDPRQPESFYFATTEGGEAGPARDPRDGGGLWKLTLEDIEHPRRGGTIELLLDGSEAPHLNKPDNVDIDTSGNLLIQEDPDDNPHLARIVAYNTATGARSVLARFDPDRFAAESPNLITTNEESSGIIDAKHVIGPGWFLFTPRYTSAAPTPPTSSSDSCSPSRSTASTTCTQSRNGRPASSPGRERLRNVVMAVVILSV